MTWSWESDTRRLGCTAKLPSASHFNIETREDGTAKVTLVVVFEPPREMLPHAGSSRPHPPTQLQDLSEQLLVECATQLLAYQRGIVP